MRKIFVLFLYSLACLYIVGCCDRRDFEWISVPVTFRFPRPNWFEEEEVYAEVTYFSKINGWLHSVAMLSEATSFQPWGVGSYRLSVIDSDSCKYKRYYLEYLAKAASDSRYDSEGIDKGYNYIAAGFKEVPFVGYPTEQDLEDAIERSFVFFKKKMARYPSELIKK